MDSSFARMGDNFGFCLLLSLKELGENWVMGDEEESEVSGIGGRNRGGEEAIPSETVLQHYLKNCLLFLQYI